MLFELTHLIDALPGLAWTALPDGRAEFLNRRWLDYTGLTAQQAADFGWIEAIHPDDREGVGDYWRSCVTSGVSADTEARMRRHDGAYRWFRFRASPVHDAAGNISRWFGINFDIEDRKRGEEVLQSNERSLSLIINTIPAHIYVLNTEGAVQFVNQDVMDYTGLTIADVQQADYRDRVIHPDDFKRVREPRAAGLRRGAPFSTEQRVLRHDGEYRWFLVRYKPLLNERGCIVRWYVAAFDIEDRKRAEAELSAQKDQLYKENLVLRDEVDRTSMFEEIVGASDALKTVLSRVARVAPTDSTVFISGETGTGKELVARAVHKRSRRSTRAFVSVNCAALPPTLISSELFGYEKGAFTGAMQRRLGRFELADGGTIFLDEVGELLPDTQAALLRVLQEREFERVGGAQPVRVDVRVIAATNRDLTAAVAKGTFRQDLFYRLNVFPIEVPPLRERKSDLLMLVEYFVHRYASRAGKHIRSIDKKTLDLLHAYDWPGNIRELQNVIERSVVLTSDDVFVVDELWLSAQTSRPTSHITPPTSLQGESGSEREIIEAALAACRGRVFGPSGAAAKLNVPSSTLAHRITALKIDKSRFKFR